MKLLPPPADWILAYEVRKILFEELFSIQVGQNRMVMEEFGALYYPTSFRWIKGVVLNIYALHSLDDHTCRHPVVHALPHGRTQVAYRDDILFKTRIMR